MSTPGRDQFSGNTDLILSSNRRARESITGIL